MTEYPCVIILMVMVMLAELLALLFLDAVIAACLAIAALLPTGRASPGGLR